MKLREEVQWFAEKMETVLRKHDKTKGDSWKDTDFEDLHNGLIYEADELYSEAMIRSDNPKPPNENVVKECVDVANFAMFIADYYRLRLEGKPQ